VTLRALQQSENTEGAGEPTGIESRSVAPWVNAASAKPAKSDGADNSQVEDDGYRVMDSSVWGRLRISLRALRQGKRALALRRRLPGVVKKEPGVLILVRHGESQWNQNKTFTGWCDPGLSVLGEREVEHAARLLLEGGFNIDVVYTSRLQRAIRSSWIILREMNTVYLPVYKSWRLNERMYGALQGLSKVEVAASLGVETVQQWRGGYNSRPPPLTPEHEYWPGNDRKHSDLSIDQIPLTESLADCMERSTKIWEERISYDLAHGSNVLIVAHANALRGLVKLIDKIGDKEIEKVKIPTGIPLVYRFDRDLEPTLPLLDDSFGLVDDSIVGRPPGVTGTFLEKKGTLRRALEIEEEWARIVPGYEEMMASNRRDMTLTPYLRSLSKLEAARQLNIYSGLTDANLMQEASVNEARKEEEEEDSAQEQVTPTPPSSLENAAAAAVAVSIEDAPPVESTPLGKRELLRRAAKRVATSAVKRAHLSSWSFLSASTAPEAPAVAEMTPAPLTATAKESANAPPSTSISASRVASAKGVFRSTTILPWDTSSAHVLEPAEVTSLAEDTQLVIIRHGKTEYNKLGLFTGWDDAPLSKEGYDEAVQAGQLLKRYGFEFDVVYTSWLGRAIETAWLVLGELDSLWLPIIKSWRLNERMYGALTGLSKKMTRQRHGAAKFNLWRRGFSTRPPSVSSFSPQYPGNDVRYQRYLTDVRWSVGETLIRSVEARKFVPHRKLPKTESLKDCMQRTIPYFRFKIVPNSINQGKRVLIASSENAIRGLLMHLCDIPENRISEIDIPTGLPLIYDAKHKCIKLLDDGLPGDPLERFKFGSAADLLFGPGGPLGNVVYDGDVKSKAAFITERELSSSGSAD